MIASELKKALLTNGFEVYRTLGDRVVLAERVRDNLIMDSGVSAVSGAPLGVRVVLRAEASAFGGETPDQLFGRVRALAQGLLASGYAELDTSVVPIADPGDRSRTLDVWYEVVFEKKVAGSDELFAELRTALGVEKTAARTSRP